MAPIGVLGFGCRDFPLEYGKNLLRTLPPKDQHGTGSQQTVLQNRPAPKASAPSQARQLQAAAGNAPRSQRSPNRESSSQVASRESNKDTSKEPLLRSFFPKISAGLSAVGQEWRGFRDGTETSEENENSRQAKQNEPRQQRSASRPQQSR